MRTALVLACLSLLPLQLYAQFQPHVDYAVGSYPFAVAVGDFNGDGKLDLAVTNSTGNTVSVLLGNGDGTFKPQVQYATGARPTSVVVGDFNRDGKLDLAIANSTDSTVSVLLGKGDGNFLPHVDYATDLNPQWLVAADFNKDGILDLATADYGPDYSGGSISIFLGYGDGTFQTRRSYNAGINPFGIVTGDFNRDGILDLAVVDNNGSWGVEILLGNWDGSFQQPPVNYSTGGANPRVGVVADFNGDGNLDLAIGNCINNDVAILFGDGAGHFSSPVIYATGDWVGTVAGADFNGDGKLDLVTANGQSNSVSVLLGNGDGTFQTQVQYAVGIGPIWVAVGDFNGDGAPDLVTTNSSANSVSVLLNDIRSTSTALVSSPNPAAPNHIVTYIATVTNPYSRANTGTVTFHDNGETIATETLANQLAVFNTKYTAAGSHAITATYSGDADSNGSTSPTLTQYVVAASKTVVATSGSPSIVGQPVTFTATVTSLYGVIPNGELVTFDDGKTVIGTGATSAGVATFTTSSLTAATHTIKGTYAGDASFKPSSRTVRQVVEKYATTTALGSSLNPSTYKQAVTFTATVTSAGPTPTGKVRFVDGITYLGSGTVTAGAASLTTSKLAVGTHSITAKYLGDADSAESTSSVLYQVVQ